MQIIASFFDHKFRIAYSKIENAKDIRGIEHPAVRGVLGYLNVENGLEIHHDGDLPARSGLGSSSSFTAGLLNAIHATQGRMISKYELAMQTIHVEQNIIGENVGSQDQVLAAMGGFNRVVFNKDGVIDVLPVIMEEARKKLLNDHLMMFFSGISRNSQTITSQKINKIREKPDDVIKLGQMVDEALKILSNPKRDIIEFGNLMHEAWCIKKSISNNITTDLVDSMYEKARANGAVGGKLMGAGGGGFMVLFVAPEKQNKVRQALNGFVHVPFQFDKTGSSICLYEPQGL